MTSNQDFILIIFFQEFPDKIPFKISFNKGWEGVCGMNLSQITDYWDHFIPVMTPVLSSQYHLTFWWKLLQCSVLTLQSHANLNKNFIFSSNHITAHSLNHKCFQSLLSPPCLATCVMESLWCQWFSIKLLSSKNNWKVIIIILWIHHLRKERLGREQNRGGDCWNKTDPLWRSQGTV